MHLNSITSWEIGRYPDVKWMTARFCLVASREEIGLSIGDSAPTLDVPCVADSLPLFHASSPPCSGVYCCPNHSDLRYLLTCLLYTKA